MRQRSLVLITVVAMSMLVLAPPALAREASGGKAANAARFVGLAELPADESSGPAAPGDTLVADAKVAEVSIFNSPEEGKASGTLKNPTREGVLLVFAVIEKKDDWLRVMLPKRPNGSTGWIKASQVKMRSVSNRIQIDVSDRKIRAYHGSDLLMEAPVAVGKSVSPTPITKAYVDISVPFRNTGGAYGAHMLSIAAYSEVLTNFGGGVGQLAIHGTAARNSVGKESSNGCIRLYNEDILKLKDLAPTGTPVDIVA